MITNYWVLFEQGISVFNNALTAVVSLFGNPITALITSGLLITLIVARLVLKGIL